MHQLKFIVLFWIGFIFFVEDGFCQTNKSSTENNGLMFIEDIQFVQKGVQSKSSLIKPVSKVESDAELTTKNKKNSISDQSISSTIISVSPQPANDNSKEINIELCRNRNFKYGQILNTEV